MARGGGLGSDLVHRSGPAENAAAGSRSRGSSSVPSRSTGRGWSRQAAGEIYQDAAARGSVPTSSSLLTVVMVGDGSERIVR